MPADYQTVIKYWGQTGRSPNPIRRKIGERSICPQFPEIIPEEEGGGGLAEVMITVTKQEIDLALGKLRRPVSTYSWLQRRLHLVNVAKDEEFRRKFTGFYRVRFLKPVPRQELFDLLEESKKLPADFGSILQKLCAITRVRGNFRDESASDVD